RGIEGVKDVHHLNIWTICSHIIALSAHVDVAPDFRDRQAGVLRAIEEALFEKHHISHTTLQVECTLCVDGPLLKELQHRPRAGSTHARDHKKGRCGHSH
ncbi:MAG: cation transporter, partial [Geobacteraceae bacterium]|nr:cation transporter [Geobacteraceae bacterium]